ncbi:MAG TPA: phosphatase PAP2 family protein [Solirubrobacteraceae bacterium]|jgi:membrane-associated phospholipid phosphatase
MPERARTALIGAGALTVLLFLIWFAAFHIGFVKRADQSIYTAFGGFAWKPHVQRVANFVAGLCNPKPYVYFCFIPVLVALGRGRFRVAAAAAAILLGANVTTELLKPLLAQPRPANLLGSAPPIGAASWPSGHATAAMSLALSTTMAVPGRLRPFIAALGALFAVAVSYSFLTLGWHYPSDVLGGFLVAGIWTLVAVAGVMTADARRPEARPEARGRRITVREALGPPSVALLGAVVLGLAVLIARPDEVVAYARLHTTFVVGVAAIGASALALATGVMLTLRR